MKRQGSIWRLSGARLRPVVQVGTFGLIATWLGFVPACAPSGPGQSVQVAGSHCWTGSCGIGSLVCINGVCETACTQAGDCSGATPACGVAPGGVRVCMATCRTKSALNFACADGVPIACDQAGQEYCEECGCPSALRCVPGVGCQERVDVGQPCEEDTDCKTEHCSQHAKVCRVPLGSACDTTNCDECVLHQSGQTACTRECDSLTPCNRGQLCLGSGGHYTCFPICNSSVDESCDGTCRATTNGRYCDCSECITHYAKRPLGGLCRVDAECAAGFCFAPTDECDANGCQTQRGTCALACATSAECGEGFGCIPIPCAEGQTSACGSMCLRTCDSDDYESCEGPVCRSLVSTEGTSLDVCDGRRQDGGECTSGRECVSGLCNLSYCAPADGGPNGWPCKVPEDCISGSCVSGGCRGLALIGDECAITADCAAGVCCGATAGAAGICTSTCN